MRSEIDHAMAGILAHEDFLGAAVCLKDGNVFLCHIPEFCDYEMLEEAVFTMTQSFPAIKDLGFELDTMDFTFSQLRLVMKELQETYILVLLKPTVKTGLVDNAIQVIGEKLCEIREYSNLADASQSALLRQTLALGNENNQLHEELEEQSFLIFGEETTFGRRLEEKLNDEDVLLFKDRPSTGK